MSCTVFFARGFAGSKPNPSRRGLQSPHSTKLILPQACGALFLCAVLLAVPNCALAQRPLGCDVSDFQGTNINWTTVKNNGIVFAWTKATEGAVGEYVSQASFTINENKGKAAGVYMGAYHFAHPGQNSPSAEANYFWSVAGPYILADGKTLMPMLDMEVFTGVTGASSYTDWANQWCSNIVAKAAAQGAVIRPAIYVSACNVANFNTGISIEYSDIADYNGKSAQTDNPWDTTACTPAQDWGTGVWHFWQYTDADPVGGEAGDGDVFNGTLASLQSTMLATVSGAPIISSMTSNVTVWQGSNATFSVTSTNTTSYQWKFNGTNIGGAVASSYTIANTKMTNGGGYSVLLNNSHGSLTSPTIFLAVLPPLTNASNSVIAPTGMVDWWTADGHLNDIFGNVNGTPLGGFYYAPGESGEAFHFDGSTAYISNGTPANIPAPWTACMWVKYSYTPQTSAALLEDGTYAIKLEQYQNTHKVGISQLTYADSTFNYTAPTNTWVHLAFVTTSTSVTLYANGVSQGSIATNSFPLPRKFIGAGYITSSAKVVDYMLGSLDEIILFNRALSVSEIDSIYNAGSVGLVRAPQVVSSQVNVSGQFLMNLKGMTGRNYTIYSSPDLINWTSLGTLANVNGTNVYFAGSVNNNPQIFYRVSQPY